MVLTLATNAPNATLRQKLLYDRQAYDTFRRYSETDHIFQLDVASQEIAGTF